MASKCSGVVPIFQISKWATTQPFCFSLSRKAASQIFYRYYGAVLLPSAAAHALAARSLRAHREVSKALATRGSELSFHLVIIIDQQSMKIFLLLPTNGGPLRKKKFSIYHFFLLKEHKSQHKDSFHFSVVELGQFVCKLNTHLDLFFEEIKANYMFFQIKCLVNKVRNNGSWKKQNAS